MATPMTGFNKACVCVMAVGATIVAGGGIALTANMVIAGTITVGTVVKLAKAIKSLK